MSVLTQHNNNQRTGVKLDEPTLVIPDVRNSFHKLFEVRVDPPAQGGPSNWTSQIVAQPLFASDVPWSDGTTKDVLIICTMHGTVYAFDAGNNCNQLWAQWLGQPVLDFIGANGQVNDDKDMFGTNPEWGILSTPVIDPDLKRVYVVMWHNDNSGTYKLHKLDLVTGNDLGQATINGAAPGAPQQVFKPVFQKQRPGLLLLKPTDLPPGRQADVGPEGTIYIAFGASIEKDPTYHGWVFAYDADTLNRRAVWCSTPNGNQAGIWQSGAGLTADEDGNIYLMTGNGNFDAARQNFGESFVKLSCSNLQVLDWFTPWYWRDLDEGGKDRDLGSSGPVCIPRTNFILGAGKVGILYSLNRNNMGQLGDEATQKDNSIDEIQATGDQPYPDLQNDNHVHGSPVYFQQLNRVYLWGEREKLKSFQIDPAGRFLRNSVVVGNVTAPDGMPGGMLSLSSPPDDAANAIIWAVLPLAGDANKTRLVEGVLRAFDARTLQEIWNSNTLANRLGSFAKFAPPTIANGRVYVSTYDGKFVVYGVA